MASQILKNGSTACQMAKDAMEVGLRLPLNDAIQYAQKNLSVCFSTDEMHEGFSAFIEKRPPKFEI